MHALPSLQHVCLNHKIITSVLLNCPASLVRFMRNKPEHLQSPSAPTQSSHAHLSHSTPQKLCTHILTQGKNTAHTLVCRSHTSHSFSLMCTQTRAVGCVTRCRDRTTSMSLSGFAQPECRALPSQAYVPPPPRSQKYPPWVLYGPFFSPTQSQRYHGHVLLSL